MKKKAEIKEIKNEGDVSHILRLWDRVVLEMNRVFLDYRLRGQIKQLINENILKRMKDMEKVDEEFQNLPENKLKNLREELERNDNILKNNTENLRNQIQEGLYKRGFPVGSAWYDSLIEKINLDIEETQLKLDSEFKVVSPQFTFQSNPRWIELQNLFHKKNLEAIKGNLKEIEENVEAVKQEINEQNERIVARRNQILEELEALGENISGFSKQNHDYIG